MHFYVQDVEHSVGHASVCWWRAGQKGYTDNVDEAGIYSFQEAVLLRDVVLVPIPMVQRIAKRRVDQGALRQALCGAQPQGWKGAMWHMEMTLRTMVGAVSNETKFPDDMLDQLLALVKGLEAHRK